MSRLVECDLCGSLSNLKAVRPIYDDGQISNMRDSAELMGVEQDIECPKCGYRTQVMLDANISSY
jgi:DNA-directed RNA polymerase subunit RPC12/RpoP